MLQGVTNIKSHAFCGYTNLASVTIPNSVTEIGYGAFCNCDNLTSVTIGNCVTSIGESAFDYCTSLENINIPDSVISIGEDAFSGTAFYNNPDNWINDVLYIDDYLIRAKDTLTNNYKIRQETKVIADDAFYGCTNLTSVTIPNGITSIGDEAFFMCKNLKSIDIPDSVTSIGAWAFNRCRSLESISIGNSVTSIGWDAFCDTAFYNNPDNWTNDVLYIDDYLIKAKDTLSGNYEIRQGAKMIADGAFDSCKNLESINIPASVTSIGWDAFNRCRSLESIAVAEGNTAYASQDGILYNKGKTEIIHVPKAIKGSVILPSSVTSIGAWAFAYCENLTSITIPDSVTYIGNGAFIECSLTSVIIPDSVTYIGGEAFYCCTFLTSITIPNSVTYIGDKAFYRCFVLTRVIIPDSVTYIGRAAFEDCENLENVYFTNPNGWYTNYSSATIGTYISSEDLKNAETAANYLEDTYLYHYWHRKTT